MPTKTKSPSATARRAEVLNQVLARHRADLRHQAARHAPRPAEAEDALQDACVQFMRAYDGPPGRDALRWMMVVVKRCAWGIGERERLTDPRPLSLTDTPEREAEPAVVLADERPEPHEAAERAERTRADLAAIDALKPDERTALLLLGLGYSYQEIAEAQGWTHTKVNRCVAEGRVRLRNASRPPR
jgi:RNA polymerase sigma factor (sigma-70 family)